MSVGGVRVVDLFCALGVFPGTSGYINLYILNTYVPNINLYILNIAV